MIRSLPILLFSVVLFSCDPEETTQGLNEIKAGQTSKMNVTQVGDTLNFTDNRSHQIKVFGNNTKYIDIVMMPYNPMSRESPNIIVECSDVQLEYLENLYFASRDTSRVAPLFDTTQFNAWVGALHLSWVCHDSSSGQSFSDVTLTQEKGHTSDLNSNWVEPDSEGVKLLARRFSDPPSSFTSGDTTFFVYGSSASPSCGTSLLSNNAQYVMFKATKGSDVYLGWIKMQSHPNGFNDGVYIESWAISENPLKR